MTVEAEFEYTHHSCCICLFVYYFETKLEFYLVLHVLIKSRSKVFAQVKILVLNVKLIRFRYVTQLDIQLVRLVPSLPFITFLELSQE